MQLLTRLGLSKATVLPDGLVLYEWSTKGCHHHYLICSRCERIMEFTRRSFAGLNDEIEALTHFYADNHTLEA